MPNSSKLRAVDLILYALRKQHGLAGPTSAETLVALHPSPTSPDRINRVMLFHAGRAVYFYLTHQCLPGCSTPCRVCPYLHHAQPACWARRARVERNDLIHLLRQGDHQALSSWDLQTPDGDDTFTSFVAREVLWLFGSLLH